MSFQYLQFSQKTNKKSTLLLWYFKSNCFCSFLGRFEDTKKTFRNELTFRALELVTLSLKIPNQAAEWEHYKLWHYNGFKVIVQLHSIYQNCRQFPFVSFTLLINCSLHKQKILSVYKSIFGITKSLVSFTNLFSNQVLEKKTHVQIWVKLSLFTL